MKGYKDIEFRSNILALYNLNDVRNERQEMARLKELENENRRLHKVRNELISAITDLRRRARGQL